MAEKTGKSRRNRSVTIVPVVVLVLAAAASVFFDSKFLPNFSSEIAVSTIAVKEKNKENFDYDRERWEKNSPRIAVLAGPHKTGSTTIQTFFDDILHLKLQNKDGTKANITPKYANSEWVWPKGGWIGPKSDSLLSHYVSFRTDKYFKGLANKSEEKRKKSRADFADTCRNRYRPPWEQGKKLLFAAENFDSLARELSFDSVRASNSGEETHVAPRSGDMVDALLDLLPWENATKTSTTIPPLRLEDIEVQINHRTPRIDHLASLWHEKGGKFSFKRYLQGLHNPKTSEAGNVAAINALAEALQFVRKGIKTTIIDMKGFYENKNLNTKSIEMNNGTMVGGLQGVIACDILKMGTDSPVPGMYCENSSIFLPDYTRPVKNKNKKHDKKAREMTDEQMHEIDLILDEYDCGVWKHLKKYQARGLLRILHPGEHLFENCDANSPDISLFETTKKIKEVASRRQGSR